MSTPAILQSALDQGVLWHIRPSLGDPTRRSLVAHQDLYRLFEEHHGIKQVGAMLGYLEGFVTGSHLTMGMTPHKHRTASMGRLSPIKDGTWEFRCRDPNPATRVFGRFLCKDTFVALDWAPRSRPIPGLEKKPLGDTGSFEWEVALGVTEQRWIEILPGLPPLIGSSASDYISENASEV